MADTDAARIGDLKIGLDAAKTDVSTRAKRDGSNVLPSQFRSAIGAQSVAAIVAPDPSGEDDAGTLSATLASAASGGYPVQGRGKVYSIAASVSIPAGGRLHNVVFSRSEGTGVPIQVYQNGVVLDNIKIDNLASVGPRSGHAVRVASADDFTARDMSVTDFGSMNGAGGGTGLLVSSFDGARPQRPRLFDSRFAGNLQSQITVGWLFDNTDFGFAGHLLAENIVGSAGIGYAHELKNNAAWSNLHALTVAYAEVGLAYGQEGAAVGGGVSYTVATGVGVKAADYGLLSGRGLGNLTVGLLHNGDGRPGSGAQSYAVGLTDETQHSAFAVSSHGSDANHRGVIFDGASVGNFVQLSAHSVGSVVVRFADTARSNVVEITHPGARSSILGAINDTSGGPTNGAGANVVYCPATGEFRGSLSGRFRWYLDDIGIAFNSAHRYQLQRNGTIALAMGTPDTAGLSAGLHHATPTNNNMGYMAHFLGATQSENTFRMGGFGVGDRYIWELTTFRPNANAENDLGTSIRRWKKGWLGELSLNNLPTYADNAAATTGGLAAGDVYRTASGQLMVRF